MRGVHHARHNASSLGTRLARLACLILLLVACVPTGAVPSPVPRPSATASPQPGRPTPLSGAAPTAPNGPAGLDKIDHFVFILQENRSFDSYFGTYPGVDGIPDRVCLKNPAGGPCVAPYHDTSAINRGAPHDLTNAMAAIDGGRMDGFVAQVYTGSNPRVSVPCPPTQSSCPPGRDPRDVMGWHDFHDIPNYWSYAGLYVLQDHMFSSVPSFTLPNRLYLLAAQSGGYLSHTQTLPHTFHFPLIIDRLTAKGVDWRYYVTSGTQPDPTNGHVVGTVANQKEHPYVFSYLNPLPAFPSVMNNPRERSRLVDTAQFYADARSGHLPQVSWVIPSLPVSEHPPYSTRVGMAYVTGLVNAVMEGPNWDSTAIFISYDEWGGFYDHVPPATLAGQSLGIRVPGLVISPYARQGYVDHALHSPASWLRLVEERYQLAPLTKRDATADDMLSDFDFTQQPRPPVILAPTQQGSSYPQPEQKIELRTPQGRQAGSQGQ